MPLVGYEAWLGRLAVPGSMGPPVDHATGEYHDAFSRTKDERPWWQGRSGQHRSCGGVSIASGSKQFDGHGAYPRTRVIAEQRERGGQDEPSVERYKPSLRRSQASACSTRNRTSSAGSARAVTGTVG